MNAFFHWYLITLFLSILFLPLGELLFPKWKDKGWIAVKCLGLFFGGYVFWAMNCAHLLKFSRRNAIAVMLFLAVVFCAVWYLRSRSDLNMPFFAPSHRGKGAAHGNDGNGTDMSAALRLIIAEEAAFLVLLAVWTYIIGFKPEAYGTEKFMDYAFITAMIRSDYMPFADPWYAGSAINYYYGGQYMSALMIRLSGVTAGEGYTLMRAFIAAASCVVPFSLVRQMMEDRILGTFPGMPDLLKTKEVRRTGIYPALAGTVAGIATAFCGNGHYILYKLILPIKDRITGFTERAAYWFPSSTRFIGYDPDVPDKTIHEFPAYSTVLGDLHAHYINILFVTALCAVIYAYAQRNWPASAGMDVTVRPQITQDGKRRTFFPNALFLLKETFASPEMWIFALMTGVFRWTNFWDFPIYYVVAGSVYFFVDLRRFRGNAKHFFSVLVSKMAFIFAAGMVFALPFTSTFDQISTEVHPTHSHSPLYQLFILWGLPAVISAAFVLRLIAERDRTREGSFGRRFLDFYEYLQLPDLVISMFSYCALGLVLLPEVVYVKDIYEGAHYRANTMFKLTYQSFILFGIVMGYVLIRAFAVKTRKAVRAAAVAGLVLVALTGGYIFTSIHSWFGDVTKPENRIHTDASVFVYESFPDDFEAVNWLNQNVAGIHTILEANGDSYTDYERVSTATGLPTVMGWYVHEWLWRSNTEAQNERASDIEAIYTGTDVNAVKALLSKYGIEYIYVGNLERDKFPALNDGVLQQCGEVVFDSGTGTYIVKTES